LRIVTLGALRVLRGDDEVTELEWRGVTTRRLLLRLLDAGERGLSRERMIDDLWPDADPENARNHLRVAVSRLHDVLEPERPDGVLPHFVLASGDTLQLRREVFDAWDVERFERLAGAVALARGPVEDADLARLREAFDACPGPLVPGMADEPWLSALRTRVEERLSRIAEPLGAALLERGAVEEADAVAARWLEVVPLDERAAALLMRGLLARGDRVGALHCFEQIRETLERGLGVVPGDSLEALAREARGGRSRP
jgi:DNA-binding SARP family transcriptional activator